ncbi:UPF0187-domain-containing protein [Calocera cornea HHB12733]|uniref:UPF0187-domain-containing protein n=1 Tax=Calocera cornea HHB12733 TaxID=1353952 RepID=A0A165HUM4_9BASI|nr:UPF0187-domain-containing protein [Calocera cornea HHB12733]
MNRRTTILPAESITRIISMPLEEHRAVLRKYSWLPDVLRIDGSVIPHILGPVLTVTIFAVGIAAVDRHTDLDIRLSNNVVPLLSVVVGLILVFRNGTSYDRYYEGRKDFATLTSQTRNIARLIWINVAPPPPTTADSSQPSAKVQRKVTKLKIRALRLLIAFPRSVVHHLRKENGSDSQEETRILTEQLRDRARIDTYRKHSRAGTGASGYGTVSELTSPVRGKETPSRSNSSECTATGANGVNQETPLLVDVERQEEVEIHISDHPLIPNMPLTIAHELTRMIWKFKRAGMLDTVGPAGTTAMMVSVQTMVDMLTAMERVSNTPIPASYGIHLKQCVTLYLFALPFTMVKDMGYGMIPIVTVVAFTLMGIEGIANQIEMPFGKDMDDLPLEKYCDEMQRDIEYVMDYLPQGDEEDGFMRDMPQEDDDDAVTF